MNNVIHNQIVYGRYAICRHVKLPVTTFKDWEADPARPEYALIHTHMTKLNNKWISTTRDLNAFVDDLMAMKKKERAS